MAELDGTELRVRLSSAHYSRDWSLDITDWLILRSRRPKQTSTLLRPYTTVFDNRDRKVEK